MSSLCGISVQVLTIYPCTVSIPPALETSGFLKQLIGEISVGLKVKVSCQKEAQSLLLLLQALSAVCGAQSILVENFGSALLRIGHVMLGDHVQGAVMRANRRRRGRMGTTSNQGDIRADVSVREFYEESCLSFLIATEVLKGRVNTDDSPDGRRIKEEKANAGPLDDLSGKILTCCLGVLFQSIDRGSLEQQKPVIVSLLAAAVEGVDNMLLVNLASIYCLKWVGHPSSPLSMGEQVVVFSRICGHSMRLQADCKKAVLARFALVSERIGELTCSSRKKIRGNAFDNTANRLGPLALFSPVQSMRDKCRGRIFAQWGPTMFGRLKGLLSLDLSSQFHSHWPSLLTMIGLSTVGCDEFRVVTGGLHCDVKGTALSAGGTGNESTDSDVWFQAVGSFVLSNPAAGHEISVALLQGMWGHLDQKRRDEITECLANNILQARHTIPVSAMAATIPFTYYTPRTVPQQLLLAFTQLTPTPRFPVEFLSCLGLSGCEGQAASLLEAMVASSQTSREAKQSRTALLASLDRLEDRDQIRAIIRSCSASSATDLALSLETYGRCDLAQSVVLQAIDSASSEASGQNAEWALESMKSSEAMKDSTRGGPGEDDDMELWECRWIQYAKELSEWSVLSAFAASAGAADLSLESAISLGDWEAVKRLRTTVPSLQVDSGLKMKIFDGMLSLVDRRYPDATDAIADATQLALCRWQQLPSISSGASCHRSLMSSLQHILELEEGKNMLVNAQSCHAARVLPDLSTGLGVWRERLPDRAENMLKWDTLLLWRTNLFAGVSRIFRGGPDDSRLAAVTDGPWTTLQLVAAARRHGLLEVGLKASQSLQTLTTLDVTDAFSKVREQVLLCLSSNQSESTAGGLNIVNTTNLDFFGPDQRAEMFRLKGLCNREMGHYTEALDCFSRSVQLGGGKRGSDWVSWGHLCYDIWERETFKYTGDNGYRGESLGKIPSQHLQLCGEHAMSSIVCILKAVECNSIPAKMLMPRVLWILECVYAACSVSDVDERLRREDQLRQLMLCFATQACEIPLWSWLPHLGAILNFLNRPGGALFLPLIHKLLAAYPQNVIGYLMGPTDPGEDGDVVKAPLVCSDGGRGTVEEKSISRNLAQLAYQTRGSLWTRIRWLSAAIMRISEPCALEAILAGFKAVSKEQMAIDLRVPQNVLERKEILLAKMRACLVGSESLYVDRSTGQDRLLKTMRGELDIDPSTAVPVLGQTKPHTTAILDAMTYSEVRFYRFYCVSVNKYCILLFSQCRISKMLPLSAFLCFTSSSQHLSHSLPLPSFPPIPSLNFHPSPPFLSAHPIPSLHSLRSLPLTLPSSSLFAA